MQNAFSKVGLLNDTPFQKHNLHEEMLGKQRETCHNDFVYYKQGCTYVFQPCFLIEHLEIYLVWSSHYG